MEEVEQLTQESHPQKYSPEEPLNESENSLSGGFDCNICLEVVQDPVVTFCGHLYCWPCIYKWIHRQTTSPEYRNQQCPVCKSNVSQKTIVPLYGRGQIINPVAEGYSRREYGMVIPCRPPSPKYVFRGTINPADDHELDYGGYRRQAPPPMTMASHGGMAMATEISPISPTMAVLGEMANGWILGNSEMRFYAFPNSYNGSGMSTPRTRMQAMQADRMLKRIFFFLLCCFFLCLILF